MQTFSQRLFRSVIPGILFTMLTAGVLLDVLISERLEEEFDQLLVAKSQGLVALTEDGENGLEVERYEANLPNYATDTNADYFEFVNDSGEVMAASLSMGDSDSLVGIDVRPSRSYLDITLPDGRAGRMLRTRFLPRFDTDGHEAIDTGLELDVRLLAFPGSPGDGITEIVAGEENGLSVNVEIERTPLTLQLAISRESLDKLIAEVHSVLVLAGLLAMGISVFLARRGINETVRPLKHIGDQVEALDERRLDQRLSVDNPVAELEVLVRRVNVLLERLQGAFERERRFSGDVAHELRTPLTELRTLIEVKQRWPDDPALKDSFNQDVGDATRRMQRIVETLLTLSRSECESGTIEPCHDLPTLVADFVRQHHQMAKQHRIELLMSLTDEPIAVVGIDQWQLMLGNLLDNAIEYGAPGSTVYVDLQKKPASNFCDLTIVNSVTDLEQQDIPHLFERLWRKDQARASTEHSGLGLALVAACARQVNVKLDCRLEGKELTISLTAPVVS